MFYTLYYTPEKKNKSDIENDSSGTKNQII